MRFVIVALALTMLVGVDAEEIDCGSPGTLTNGWLEWPMAGILTNGIQTTLHAVVNFHCNAGYTLYGPSSSFCQENGTWSRDSTKRWPPTCHDCGNTVECSALESYCDTASDTDTHSYSDWMLQNCLLTCGLHFGLTCEDKHSGCSGLESNCDKEIAGHDYYAWMAENCQKTCGLCPVNAHSDQKCANWASYCDEDSVYYAWMKINCKQTCGLCDTD